MGIEVVGIGGFVLLVLDSWSVVSSGASAGGAVVWAPAILILPLLGSIARLVFGPRAARR